MDGHQIKIVSTLLSLNPKLWQWLGRESANVESPFIGERLESGQTRSSPCLLLASEMIRDIHAWLNKQEETAVRVPHYPFEGNWNARKGNLSDLVNPAGTRLLIHLSLFILLSSLCTISSLIAAAFVRLVTVWCHFTVVALPRAV